MDETNFRSILRHSFKAEGDERGEVTAKFGDWDAKGRKIRRVEGAFLATSSNSDDAAEEGGNFEKREEVGDETETRIVIQ